MGNSGSSSKKDGSKLVTKQDEAVLQMKMQRDEVKKYQRRIRVVLNREVEIAKECLAKGDKQRALLALRKKKYQEKLLVQTDQQLATLEELTQSVEFAQIQKDVMFGLEQGNQVLKEIHKELTLERVEKIMDDSAEGIAYQQEISNMLSQNISNSDELDVLEELEALEREEIAKQIPQMPEVPNAVPHGSKDTESNRKQESEEEEEEEEEKAEDHLANTKRQPVLA